MSPSKHAGSSYPYHCDRVALLPESECILRVQRLFDDLDEDKDGFTSNAELSHIMQRLDAQSHDL